MDRLKNKGDNFEYFVVVGRERHVDSARKGFLPYPQRAIRTKDHLLIINFAPDRYPMGDPGTLVESENPIPYAQLEADTFAVYADMDAGPTKAWMVWNRHLPQWRRCFDLNFEKRPRIELYDLKNDSAYMNNVAETSEYSKVRSALERRLLSHLAMQKDPRVTEDVCRFEFTPYAGPLQPFQQAPFGWPEDT